METILGIPPKPGARAISIAPPMPSQSSVSQPLPAMRPMDPISSPVDDWWRLNKLFVYGF
ncbi:unnamed protein product [Spirodela intermedia]|uniref:Uncharacterized protein n=1 Tax=Spirodela intermedia TaxID=51605 RepID=A0A7I8K5R5_SPIIN|nr:unnamed protein product [Spirodela intermedia]